MTAVTLPQAETSTRSVDEEAPRFFTARVFAPGAVFTALAIGSGELVFWPQLTFRYGLAVIVVALAGLALQYVLDLEIGRYSLVTGESVVVGATRLSKIAGVALLLGAIVPWLWPGWARAGSQIITISTGMPEKIISLVSLIVCGLLLSTPRRVYGVVEKLQTVLLAFILVGLAIVCLTVLKVFPPVTTLMTPLGVGALLTTFKQASGPDYFALVSGLVFIGAGGILNIGYGLMLCEKGFAMGQYAEPIRGLRHSFGLGTAASTATDHAAEKSAGYWQRWMSLLRREHILLFVGGNTFTVVCIALLLRRIVTGHAAATSSGMKLLEAAIGRLSEVGGAWLGVLFVGICYAVFFTSELGILDVTSRIASGIVCGLPGKRRWSPSAIFHLFVWIEIVVGIAVIFLDPRQPYWFLVTSGILNTIVMAFYSGLLIVLNRRLPANARPNVATLGVLGVSVVAFLALFGFTLARL
jgi:hypothetical protein